MYKLPSRSEAELLDLYADEMSLEWSTTDESEADVAKQVGAHFAPVEEVESIEDTILTGVIRCINQDPTFRLIGVEPKIAPQFEQQLCRPYAASTIMFDSAVPEESDDELLVRSAFFLDDEPALITDVDAADEVVTTTEPTPELLDTSDLNVRPTRVDDTPLHDAVSQLLDIDIQDIDETAFMVAVQRAGRSLMRDPPPFSDDDETVACDNVLELELDEQGKPTKRKLNQLDRDCGPRGWELESDRVLRQITGQAFLPGIEHLTNIEARATFLCYEDGIIKVQEDDTAFLSDRSEDKCSCVEGEVGRIVVLPGEDLLLSDTKSGM
jgi:hypothetical protein